MYIAVNWPLCAISLLRLLICFCIQVDVIPLIFTMPGTVTDCSKAACLFFVAVVGTDIIRAGYLNDQLNQEKEEEKKAMKNTPLKIEKIFTPGVRRTVLHR